MDIDTLEAGCEMDALVAEKIMGWHFAISNEQQRKAFRAYHWFLDKTGFGHINFRPSTDIAAAWEVIEKSYELTGCTITVHLFGTFERVNKMPKYMCKFYGGKISHPTPSLETKAFGDTAPLAICRAALKAVQNR